MNEDKTNQIKQLTAIAWYDAGTMRALLVAAVGLIGVIASLFGVDEALFSAKAAKVVDPLSTLIAVGGVVWAGIARTRQPTPPVTLTQAGADQHNVENPTRGVSHATPESALRPLVPTVDPEHAGGVPDQPTANRSDA